MWYVVPAILSSVAYSSDVADSSASAMIALEYFRDCLRKSKKMLADAEFDLSQNR